MRDRESGQATVEFALSLILILGFVLFLIQIALIFGWGSYIQYATHMAARAYRSAGPTREDQRERAQAVIYRALKRGRDRGNQDRMPMIARGEGGQEPTGMSFDDPRFDPNIRALSWLEGVRYTFRSKVFLLPLGRLATSGTRSASDVNSVTLTSESMLGREDSFEECVSQVQSRSGGLIDNGC